MILTTKTYFGYGINLSKTRFKPFAEEILWEKAKNVELVKQNYADFCEDNDHEPDPEMTWMLDAFIEEYADETHYFDGIDGLLLDTLNAAAGSTAFTFEGGCLYVNATLPKDEEEKRNMLTQERIRELLSEYVVPLLKEPAEIKWQFVVYCEGGKND